jgi:hypothetical protein
MSGILQLVLNLIGRAYTLSQFSLFLQENSVRKMFIFFDTFVSRNGDGRFSPSRFPYVPSVVVSLLSPIRQPIFHHGSPSVPIRWSLNSQPHILPDSAITPDYIKFKLTSKDGQKGLLQARGDEARQIVNVLDEVFPSPCVIWRSNTH